MGHKKQNAGGFNGSDVAVILLEYHNFLENENPPWRTADKSKPGLAYDAGAAKKKPTKTWEQIREHARGTLHHENATAVSILDQMETLLTNPRYVPLAAQIKDNRIRDYLQRNG
jgi:hypothetical protein